MTAGPRTAARRLGFKRHLRALVATDEAVYLFSEEGLTALRGGHVKVLAPLLDGSRDVPTVLAVASRHMPPEQTGSLIAQLDAAGLLALRAPARTAADESTLAYWEASGLDADTAVRGTTCPVQLVPVGDVDCSAARAALQAAGLSVTTDAGTCLDVEAQLSVVLCHDYLQEGLADIDAAHRAAGRPWLLAKPGGVRVWIGPVFPPTGQPCWHCLAAPLRNHRQAEAYVQAMLGRTGPVDRRPVSVPALAATALHLIALEAAKWLAGYRYPGQRAVWTLDSRRLSGRHHEVRARPQCSSCGDPTITRSRAWQPVRLQSRRAASGCGHRSLPPEQVLDRCRHLISPVTGVVKEIRRDTRGPAFFQCFRAGSTLAAGGGRPEGPRSPLCAESVGKGVTALHAEVSALCEALERHSGCFHGDEQRIRASYDSLHGEALHPNDCQLFHQRQFLDRHRWNAAHSPLQRVCDPFDDSAVLDWTPVWSLSGRRHRLLPTGMLYYGAPVTPGRSAVRTDSNGNAAGSSMEDAVLQGLLELVERDAVALWWYNRTRQPAVDLDAFADPWTAELREVYAGIRRDVWVLDLTADLAIPVMAAVSRRIDAPREDIVFGFGADLDPRVALRRALTELNQLMPALLDGTPDGRDEPDAARWWRHATAENQPYLLPHSTPPARTPADYGYRPSLDLGLDVQTIQQRLEAVGLELLVLDQTRPDIGLPVVKVIVPGLRHFWARFAPGRLYDIPVRLGRLPRLTEYDDLNPYPMFL